MIHKTIHNHEFISDPSTATPPEKYQSDMTPISPPLITYHSHPSLTLLTSPLPPPGIIRGLTSRSTVCPGATFLASRGAGSRLCALLCASSLSMAAGSASGLFTAGRDSARSVEVTSAESLVRWRSRLREPAHGFSSSSPLWGGVKSDVEESA